MKITKTEYLTGIVIAFVSLFLGTGVYSLIKSARTDATLSIIFFGIAGILTIPVFLTIFNYEPSLTLKGKIIKIFGPKLGFIFNIYFEINVFFLMVSTFYNLTNLISTQFLTNTSKIFIGLVFVFTIAYASFKNVKTTFKLSNIIFYINVILALVAFFSLFGKVDLSNFFPIMENGIMPTLKGTFYLLVLNSVPIFTLLIIPKANIQSGNQKRAIIMSYVISVSVSFIIMFATLGVLGIYVSSIYEFPEYIVLKQINILNFVDRIESIVVLQWIFGLFILLLILTFFITRERKIIDNNFGRSIIILSAMIASIYCFKNQNIYLNILYNYTPYLRLVMLAILITLYFLIKIKKKTSSANNI